MIKKTLISALALVACIIGIQAQTQVIAHRGFWKTEGSAQNSIAALEKAAEENLYGSEFDVQVRAESFRFIYPHIGFQIRMVPHHAFIHHSNNNGWIARTKFPSFITIYVTTGQCWSPFLFKTIFPCIHISPL